MSIYSWYSHPK